MAVFSKYLLKFMNGIWLLCVLLLTFTIFGSKSAISIFGLTLVIFSLFKINWRQFLKEIPLVLLLALYPLGFVVNYFSLGGWESAYKFLYSWPWPLFILPAYVVSEKKMDSYFALAGLAFGLIGGCLKALHQFAFVHHFRFENIVRVTGFWEFGRWGVFLAASCAILWCLLISYKNYSRPLRFFVSFLFALGLVCLLLSNSRGPWLAFGLGAGLACLIPPMRKSFIVGGIVLAVGIFSVNAELRNRIVSVFEVTRTADGTLASKDDSNEGRLNMWKVGFDFFKEQPWFGTGFESVEKPLRAYVAQQPQEYRDRYVHGEFVFHDQHSSYLSSLVQTGVLYFICLWATFFYFLFFYMRKALKGNELARGLSVLTTVYLLIFIFYSSYNSYEMLLFFPIVGALAKEGLINKFEEAT